MSPLATRVQEAGFEAIRKKAVPTAISVSDFFEPSDAVRERFARLVGSPDPGRVAIIPASSYAVATCARNLDLRSGRNVVMVEEQFPGNVYTWRTAAQRTGLELRSISVDPGPARGRRWNERILDAIDADTEVVTPRGHPLDRRNGLRPQ